MCNAIHDLKRAIQKGGISSREYRNNIFKKSFLRAFSLRKQNQCIECDYDEL